MSIVEQARIELAAVNFGEEDSRVMIEILEKFFDQWDSGGAVFVAAPVLQRLIAGCPLTPLTGADDEWVDVCEDFYQNRRCGSVFKVRTEGSTKMGYAPGTAYDIDVDGHPPIAFPYWPPRTSPLSPVVEFVERESAS